MRYLGKAALSRRHLSSVLAEYGFSGGASGKHLPASTGDVRDVDSIAGLERSPGEGKGYPLQCSVLENSMDSIESDTIEQLSLSHAYIYIWFISFTVSGIHWGSQSIPSMDKGGLLYR